MEQQKVDMFMMTNAKFFPEDKTLLSAKDFWQWTTAKLHCL